MTWDQQGRITLVAAVAIALAAGAEAAPASRVSVGGLEQQGNRDSANPSLSGNGRLVAFESAATNLVPGDGNGQVDIFVRDRQAGTTRRVSVSSGGGGANGSSSQPAMSRNGRFVIFNSVASNLVNADTNGARDVFVRDLQAGTISRVSAGGRGQANGESRFNAISGSGSIIAFASLATNLGGSDTNGTWDVFIRNRETDRTSRISVNRSGGSPNGSSIDAVLSANGRYVAFTSDATNLVDGDTNGQDDVFVRDREGGTRRVSVSSNGQQGNRPSAALGISDDGRYVLFTTAATNLVPADGNGKHDIFVRDRANGRTSRVSVGAGDEQSNGPSDDAVISPNGRFVAFRSAGSNLVAGDTNGSLDIFLRDRVAGTTRRISEARNGGSPNAGCFDVAVSDNAELIAFSCSASNVVANDTNRVNDVFVRPR